MSNVCVHKSIEGKRELVYMKINPEREYKYKTIET